jgi:hypothetical protein
VEEVKRTALAASAFVFISIQSSCSVIDPQALKVRQVCGTAAIASAQLSLRAEGSTSEIHVPTAHNGRFSFGNIPAGIYRLSTTWQEKNGNVQQPIHNLLSDKSNWHKCCRSMQASCLGRHASGI